MKKRIIFIILVTLSIKINAQRIKYSNNNFLKNYYYCREGQNETLKIKEIQNIVKNNSEALEYIKKGKKFNSLSYIPFIPGSFLLGVSISQISSADKNINWLQAGIGVGLIGISIPISKNGTKNIIKGIDKYNSTYLPLTNNTKELKFVTSINGLGFCFSF